MPSESKPAPAAQTAACRATGREHVCSEVAEARRAHRSTARARADHEDGRNAGVECLRLDCAGLGQASFTLAQLPTSKTPITDVISARSVVVGGVVGAVVEVAQVPGDLASLARR